MISNQSQIILTKKKNENKTKIKQNEKKEKQKPNYNYVFRSFVSFYVFQRIPIHFF